MIICIYVHPLGVSVRNNTVERLVMVGTSCDLSVYPKVEYRPLVSLVICPWPPCKSISCCSSGVWGAGQWALVLTSDLTFWKRRAATAEGLHLQALEQEQFTVYSACVRRFFQLHRTVYSAWMRRIFSIEFAVTLERIMTMSSCGRWG